MGSVTRKMDSGAVIAKFLRQNVWEKMEVCQLDNNWYQEISDFLSETSHLIELLVYFLTDPLLRLAMNLCHIKGPGNRKAGHFITL